MSWRRFGGHVKVRGDLWAGGTVYVGSSQDTAWAREAANRMYTPDALAVGGSADLRGATRIRGAGTVDGAWTFGGTPVVMPYGTASPAPEVNGEYNLYHKSNVARLTVYSGGTPYTLAFPTTTHGTVTVTVGSPP